MLKMSLRLFQRSRMRDISNLINDGVITGWDDT